MIFLKEKGKSIYESLDEFVKEYSPVYDMYGENSRGMDFYYKGKLFRICLEVDGYYVCDSENDFEILGICEDMEKLLVSKFIDNREFKEIVMDEENTLIYGKD